MKQLENEHSTGSWNLDNTETDYLKQTLVWISSIIGKVNAWQ